MNPPNPTHGQRGQFQMFYGKDRDRGGHDLYCGCCNTWNTVEGTRIWFSLIGECKHCGAPLGKYADSNIKTKPRPSGIDGK